VSFIDMYDSAIISMWALNEYVTTIAQALAGGAAAAAPDGGALAGPSASPHLPVAGVGNPVAVLGLARQGAKRADNAIR
jgi:hypothetical protein